MSTLLNLDTYTNEEIMNVTEYPITSALSPSMYSEVSSNDKSYYNLNSSPSTCSRSPLSTSSDTSQTATNLQNLNIGHHGNFTGNTFGGFINNNVYHNNNNNNTNNNNNINMGSPMQTQYLHNYSANQPTNINQQPSLVITEQPIEKFRFRYKSEMHGTHGSLMGRRSEKSCKKYPTVELRGYKGEAVIRCLLYQTEKDSLARSQHSHRLVVRDGDIDRDDPHDVIVSTEKGFQAIFQGMGIIHTAKKYIVEELFKKKVLEKQVELGRVLTSREEHQLKKQAEQEAKTMNLNQVCLCFQAYIVENDVWKKLCEPVYSNPINNMKSALTGELKISRLSAASSSAAGGDDLILLVEKVGKKNIKVRFFELDDEDREVWEAYGIFTEVDVHHQYAIALRTPPYKNLDITEPVDVFIQLYRPSDHDRSENMPFRYKPRNYTGRKRPRISSSASSNNIPTTVRLAGSTGSSMSSSAISLNELRLNTNEIENLLKDFRSSNESDLTELMHLYPTEFKNATILETDGTSTNTAKSVIQRGPLALPILKRLGEVAKYLPDPKGPHREEDVNLLRRLADIVIEGDNILHWSIRYGEVDVFEKLMQLIDKYKLDEVLQLKNHNDETCLHIACANDRTWTIRSLLNIGASPNLSDNKGNTPLHVAIERGNDMCISKILDEINYTLRSKKLEIDLANHDGLTALHLAVKKQNLKFVQMLIEKKASIKIAEKKQGNNVLHIAVEQEATDIVKYLLENTNIRSNINSTNSSGYTPLHLACASKNSENMKSIIALLLDKGADPLIVHNGNRIIKTNPEDLSDDDDDDETPCNSFELAKNKPEILQMLKEKSARVLHGHIKKEYLDDTMDIDSSSPQSQSTDKENNEIIEFDEDCLVALCQILNKQSKWKQIAHKLDFQAFIPKWDTSSNPTKNLLNSINKKVTTSKFVNVLSELGERDAITAVDNMVAGMNEPDFE